jgi:hypothetical protein
MSATQPNGYKVEDWLAALEREERRLLRTYVVLDAWLGLVGLAMVIIPMLWPPSQFNPVAYDVVYGGIIVLAALCNSPVGIGLLNRTFSTAAIEQARKSGLGARLLAGEIDGNELFPAFPRMWRWLVRPVADLKPTRILQRVATWSNHYGGYPESSLMPIALALISIFYLCIGWGGVIMMNIGWDDFPASIKSQQLLYGIVMALGAGTAMPIILLLSMRANALFIIFPVLKRQWQAQLEQDAG